MPDYLYNLAFERAILSSIIFEPASFENVIGVLQDTDFYLPAHSNIYNAITTLFKNEIPIDEEFLKKELVKKKQFDEQVMLEILSANPIANIKAYIEEVIDKSRLRQLLSLSGSIRKHAIEECDTSDAVISRVESELESIINRNSTGIEIVDIDEIEDKETEFVLKGWMPIPVGTVTIVSAPGGTGKSWLANQMALRYKTETNKTPLLWLSEDPLHDSKSRAQSINKDILHNDVSVRNIRFIADSPMPLMQNKKFSFSDFYKMRRAFKAYDFIVLDPLLAFYVSDENDNSQARQFMQPFMNWAREENKCIIFLHHSKKGGEGVKTRGAGAFVDACRTVYELEKIDGDDNSGKRKLILSKDNLGAIKHLDAFTMQRQITPSRKDIPIVRETIYDSDVPFQGTKISTNPTQTENSSVEMPLL